MVILQINGCTQLCATAQSMLLCLIVLLLHAHALLLAMVSVRLGTLHDIECISLRDIERVSLRGVHACRSPPMLAACGGVMMTFACSAQRGWHASLHVLLEFALLYISIRSVR